MEEDPVNDSQRLNELDKKITAKQNQLAGKNNQEEKTIGGTQFISELAAAMLVGGFLGYYIDRWFATEPLFFTICLFLGVAAGVLNIYKLSVKNDGNDSDEKNDDNSR